MAKDKKAAKEAKGQSIYVNFFTGKEQVKNDKAVASSPPKFSEQHQAALPNGGWYKKGDKPKMSASTQGIVDSVDTKQLAAANKTLNETKNLLAEKESLVADKDAEIAALKEQLEAKK